MSSAGKATGEERRGEEGRGEEGSQVVSEDGGFQGQIGQGLLGCWAGEPRHASHPWPGYTTPRNDLVIQESDDTYHSTLSTPLT